MKALRAKLRLSAAPELENVAVVNRYTYSGPYDNTFVYIGPGTPLGNQWSHRNGTALYKVETREESVSRFNDWLAEQIANAKGPVFNFIHELKERIANGEQIKLACSCAPELCSGDVVKATLELLIHNERHPQQTLEREELQLNLSSPQRVTATAPVNERQQTPPLSARAEQAHAEVLAMDSITDNIPSIYALPEGLTRAQHTSRLNNLDQFARDAYERGATLTENVLSIPRDPDARPRDETKVTIGTEAHAINFVRSFIDDPKLAEEKGKLLFQLADKACGQWIDSNGRLTIFNHIYTEIRQDQAGAYRDNDQKAQVIDQVLAETATWAQPLPEPSPDPTPEDVHEYTLALAEENRAELEASLLPALKTDLREIQTEPEISAYLDHLNSSSYGLATLGELAGFTFENPIEDENQIHAEMFEAAIAENANPATDHLAERENSISVTLDASYDRINLSALPPQLPDTLTSETRSELFHHILPLVDTQLERGASKNQILTPLYESSRVLEQQDLARNVNNTFARAGHGPFTVESISRDDQLTAISSLRILVRAEYVEATKGFTREAIQFAKANYRVNADSLRSQGKLQKGEYQRIVTSQKEERSAWLLLHPGQKVPTRAEIANINNLERTGQQLNATIAGLNPIPQEHARALDEIQSRLTSSKHTCETLLQNFADAEQTSRDLAAEAAKYAETVRATPQFQDRKEALNNQCRENLIVEQEWLARANNGSYDLADNRKSATPNSPDTQRSSIELLAEILPLEDKLISRDVNLEYLWYQAQSPGGVDLPLLRGIADYDGRFYPVEPFSGFPSTLGPENGFASHDEAQTFIDNFSQQRDPDEQQLLNLYHEIGQSLKDELPGRTDTQVWYEDWLAWENTQIAQFEERELTESRELADAQINAIEENFNDLLLDIYEEQLVGGPDENFLDHEEIGQTAPEYQISSYPDLTGDPVAPSAYAKIAQANHNAERDDRQNLNQLLINPQIERNQAINDAQLASYREVCTHLCGQNISGAGEAREALNTTLQGIEKATAQIDTTRIRFGINEPVITTNLSPSPTYVSLASNSNVRIAIDNAREHHVLITTAQQCRLETRTWSNLYSQRPLTGNSQEREGVNRFVSEYIDFRLKDHTTQQLSDNPTFRNYSQRVASAKTPEEMVQTGSQIKLENYEFHKQLVAHRADPKNVPAPVRQPLTVMEMREVFLSTTPSPTASPADRAEMRNILYSMAVFGKEKEERVKLLAEDKLTPSPTLAKLLANLESRQTVAAVNHFYRSLRTPNDQLLTKNSFDLHQAHARLPQYERDYLHRHAITQRYALLNAKEQGTQLTPDPLKLTAPPNRTSEASKTALYREYYGRADWLEAQKIVTAGDVNPNTLNRCTIVPELTDLEVRSISYVVNNFDHHRQEQVAEFLKSSQDEHSQAIGDMITVAAQVKVATSAPDIREIELQLPTFYTLAPDSVTSIVNYTESKSERAESATRLPAGELSELRQEAQAQTWREMETNIVKDASANLDAPAATLYKTQEVSRGIQHIASLQERARTAFQVINTHTEACVNKVEQTLTRLAKSTDNPFRDRDQQQTTRQLVKLALDPQLQNPELIKAYSTEYTLIQRTVTTADRDRAMQLREYAANTRADYLSAFPQLDRDQQALRHETPIQSPAVGTLTTADRYTLAREQISRTALGETVQVMVQERSLPQLSPEQIATLTVKDLIPPDIREQAFEQAREPAWESLEPHELRDDAEGRQVAEPLLTLANEVMDHVAIAQTIELQIDKAQTALNSFVNEQIAIAEAPVREQRAELAYDEEFRQTLNTLANDTSQPERSEAAHQIIETLNKAELDQATLVSQAETQQLDAATTNVILEANEQALVKAEKVRIQPIATTPEAHAAVEQTSIAELKGPTQDRYAALRGNLDDTQKRFRSALQAVDEKSAQLDLARTQVSIQSQITAYKEISQPAAVQINAYLKDTVRNEGLPALFDSGRTNEHVNQLVGIIINTARDKGITLAGNRESAQQVTAIASNLFNTLASGIERANSEHALSHQLTHQYETTSHLNQQTYNELVVAAPTGSHDHAAHASFDQTEAERRREQLDRQKQTNISTNKLDQSGRQPSASDVTKTQEIAQTSATAGPSLGANATELGGSVEDLAAVLAL